MPCLTADDYFCFCYVSICLVFVCQLLCGFFAVVGYVVFVLILLCGVLTNYLWLCFNSIEPFYSLCIIVYY